MSSSTPTPTNTPSSLPEKVFLATLLAGAAVGVVAALANGYPWRWFQHGPDRLQQHDDLQAALAQPPIAVTAQRLAVDYTENEIRADGLYRGRMLDITGTVAGVFWDQTTGEPVVMLECSDVDDIRARFDVGNDELRHLRAGQRVTVDCLADPSFGVPVPRFWHCRLR